METGTSILVYLRLGPSSAKYFVMYCNAPSLPEAHYAVGCASLVEAGPVKSRFRAQYGGPGAGVMDTWAMEVITHWPRPYQPVWSTVLHNMSDDPSRAMMDQQRFPE